ncbi:hypothetical protein M0805_009618 [Coniferiporia weirii]|nr:hypothetical protein M0805_009618 [Coniferiporia weirii]
MSSEPRPRRTTRAVVKVPTELTAGASTSRASRSRTGPTQSGASSARRPTRAGGKGKGKRTAGSDDEDEIDANGGPGNDIAKLEGDEGYDIEHVLTSPQSPLVNLDISDVLNFHTWSVLSPESQERLCKLLPPTAFGNYPQQVDYSHPSKRAQNADEPMQVDETPALQGESATSESRILDPSFFTDPHFESAARTFQDHLYSGWLMPSHRALVEKHLAGVQSGSLHAPWKDEVWERNHFDDDAETGDEDSDEAQSPLELIGIGVRTGKRKGKESKTSEFAPLVNRGLLRKGDVISFKHKFTSLGITIEKDALVSEIHPKTSVLTLTSTAGLGRDLPPALLIPHPSATCDIPVLREMYVSTPQLLVHALLDLDGRVPRASRTRFNVWKALSVWRWSGDAGGIANEEMSEEEAALLERGGREVYGTLFYLRGAALDG